MGLFDAYGMVCPLFYLYCMMKRVNEELNTSVDEINQ